MERLTLKMTTAIEEVLLEEYYEKIQAELRDKYELVYVDYRDSFDENLDLQEAILKGSEEKWDLFNEAVDQWISEMQWERANDIVLELMYELIEDKHDRETFHYSEHYTTLVFEVQERDESDVYGQLMRNTSGTWITYDFGIEFGDTSFADDETLEEFQYEMSGALGIERSEAFDEWATNVLSNATYGGRLMALWHGSVQDVDDQIVEGSNVITFPKGFEIGLIDYMNGSGYTEEITFDVKVKFDRDNLALDSNRRYSFANDVCGLSSRAFQTDPKIESAS